MANVIPESENFFYWAPEDLQDYARCEPGIRCNKIRDNTTARILKESGSEFISPISALIRKKGA